MTPGQAAYEARYAPCIDKGDWAREGSAIQAHWEAAAQAARAWREPTLGEIALAAYDAACGGCAQKICAAALAVAAEERAAIRQLVVAAFGDDCPLVAALDARGKG